MEIIIRKETERDYHEAEHMTQKAFWNLHAPGCDEHLLVHNLRADESYLPELSRVAEYEGRVIGAIYYAKAIVRDGQTEHEVITFGPLCVEPEYQSKGVGGKLIEHTAELAREQGYKAIVIFGEPGYYPRHGFVTCDRFGITTENGANFDAFMARELYPGALGGIKGCFIEPPVYFDLPKDKVEEHNGLFPYMEKLVLPGQWGQGE